MTSIGEGGVGFPACITGHMNRGRGSAPGGDCIQGMEVYIGGECLHGGGQSWVDPPAGTRKASGTHPTGMLPCSHVAFVLPYLFETQPPRPVRPSWSRVARAGSGDRTAGRCRTGPRTNPARPPAEKCRSPTKQGQGHVKISRSYDGEVDTTKSDDYRSHTSILYW